MARPHYFAPAGHTIVAEVGTAINDRKSPAGPLSARNLQTFRMAAGELLVKMNRGMLEVVTNRSCSDHAVANHCHRRHSADAGFDAKL